MITMTRRQVTAEIRLVTPGDAAAMLEHNGYRFQRKLRPWWVDQLVEQMKAGRFKPGTQIEFAQYPDWHLELTNGQHTLHAIVKSGIPQLLTVNINPVESGTDTAHIYSVTDIQAKRHEHEIYAAYELPRLTGLNPRQINAVSAAVKMIRGGFPMASGRGISIPTVMADIQDYAAEALEYWDAIRPVSGLLKQGMERSATLGVALVTFRYAADVVGLDKVSQFWHRAAHTDDLKTGDPARLVNWHLLTTRLSRSAVRGIQAVTPSYSARYIAACWNAYTEGRSLSMAKVFNAAAPIVIKHSPFKGKER